jgi:hypothetical protein
MGALAQMLLQLLLAIGIAVIVQHDLFFSEMIHFTALA